MQILSLLCRYVWEARILPSPAQRRLRRFFFFEVLCGLKRTLSPLWVSAMAFLISFPQAFTLFSARLHRSAFQPSFEFLALGFAALASSLFFGFVFPGRASGQAHCGSGPNNGSNHVYISVPEVTAISLIGATLLRSLYATPLQVFV